ncbi:MAG TPA: hypothetical protein VIU40_10320, partial [Geobacteraceae bacterium]
MVEPQETFQLEVETADIVKTSPCVSGCNERGQVKLTLAGALVALLAVAGFAALALLSPQYASAWPTKYSSCSGSG